MSEDTIGGGTSERARALADRLREQGFGAYAEQLDNPLAPSPPAEDTSEDGVGHALLETFREACRTVLTAIEAIDPTTQLMAEELRLEVDKRLADR